MPVSACYNRWVLHKNSKGLTKWINEGPAPEGSCPSCPDMQHPVYGTWDGKSAACIGGNIRKYVADGNGGQVIGGIIHAAGTAAALQACGTLGNSFIGTGDISNYF